MLYAGGWLSHVARLITKPAGLTAWGKWVATFVGQVVFVEGGDYITLSLDFEDCETLAYIFIYIVYIYIFIQIEKKFPIQVSRNK